MTDRYSLYEAKSKLSALIRQVREGRTVVITVHGEPVAELKPFDKSTAPLTLESRVRELDTQGAIFSNSRDTVKLKSFSAGPRKPGALKRFLEERE